MTLPRLTLGIACLFLLGISPPLSGQVIVQQARNDLPVVTSLSPLGVLAGDTAEITVSGQRLQNVTGVLGAPGVELAEVLQSTDKQVKLRIRVSSAVIEGAHPFHLLCKSGLSNPRLLRVDRLPQAIEAEPNNSLDKPQKVILPHAVTGSFGPADEDYYGFEVSAGQRVVFDMESGRLGYPVRPLLTLFDARGAELAKTVTPPPELAPDSRLVYTFPQSGKYVLRVSDRTFQGGAMCHYYLRMGEIPFATGMFPLGGRRGEHVKVTLRDGGLSQPMEHVVDLSGEVVFKRARLIIPTSSGGIAAPALFAVGEHPEVTENEPNDRREAAMQVAAPVTINGRMDRRGDRDCFRFQAEAGAKLTIRVLANQLGSRLDAVLTIHNAQGRTLNTTDDSPAPNRQGPMVRRAVAQRTDDDAVVQFTAPAKGDYFVSLDDRYYFGGEQYAYRLEIAPQRPDFELVVQPGQTVPAQNNRQRGRRRQQVIQQFNGAGTGALSVDRGGRGSLVVKVVRQGYNGPIRLAAENLPPGLTLNETTIPAGQNQANMTFHAGFDAPSSARFVRILGSADVEQRRTIRLAQQPVIFSGMPGAVALQTLDFVAVGVSGQGAELAIRGELAGPLAPGGTSRLRINVHRRQGFKGEVAVRALSLPSGLKLPAIKVPDGKDMIEVQLAGEPTLAPGKRSLQLEARLTVKGRPQPLVAVAPVTVVVEPLVALELLTPQVEVSQGGKAQVRIKVRRSSAFQSSIALSLSRLPRGVTAAPQEIPDKVQEFTLDLAAGEAARPSPIRRIIQIRPEIKFADKTLQLPTLRFALKVVR